MREKNEGERIERDNEGGRQTGERKSPNPYICLLINGAVAIEINHLGGPVHWSSVSLDLQTQKRERERERERE